MSGDRDNLKQKLIPPSSGQGDGKSGSDENERIAEKLAKNQKIDSAVAAVESATITSVFSKMGLDLLQETGSQLFNAVAFPFVAASALTRASLAWRAAHIQKYSDKQANANAAIEVTSAVAINVAVGCTVALSYGAATAASAAIASFGPEIFLGIMIFKTVWGLGNAIKTSWDAHKLYKKLEQNPYHQYYEGKGKNDKEFTHSQREDYFAMRKQYMELKASARKQYIGCAVGALLATGVALLMVFAAPVTLVIKAAGAIGAIVGGVVGLAMAVGGMIHGWWSSRKAAQANKIKQLSINQLSNTPANDNAFVASPKSVPRSPSVSAANSPVPSFNRPASIELKVTETNLGLLSNKTKGPSPQSSQSAPGTSSSPASPVSSRKT